MLESILAFFQYPTTLQEALIYEKEKKKKKKNFMSLYGHTTKMQSPCGAKYS